MMEFRESLPDAECEAEFDQLFPRGFAGSDVREEIPFDTIDRIVENDTDETERNIRELVGRCLWDIFADQHEVVRNDGRLVDIGGGRGAGEFLADYLNRRTGRRNFDYMSFYMGNSAPWSEREGDLKKPPPPIVQAYQNVYGRWPEGWPPTRGV